jgi:LPPG:FO 2-phospho-L-lactate transferase
VRVTALAGGTGAAKLLRGLAACLSPRDLTVIGNTGDDTEVWGLHVSPDLDTVAYALAGLLDVERGWGRAEETFRCLEAMGALGAPTWFGLGDRDLATHLLRTAALRAGEPLSAVTARLAARLGVATRILPMSDQPVRTFVTTRGGRLSFQEYFVRDRAQGEVVAVDYEGAPAARPAPGVAAAIAEADLVVVCPSNPVTSVGPILAVPGVAAALAAAPGPVVGVTPIVGGAPVSGPAGRLMRARGLDVSPLGVAAAYAPWLRALLVDERDRAAAPALERAGVRAVVADVMMTDRAREVALARRVLQAAG